MFQAISDFESNIEGLKNHLQYEASCQLFFQSGIKRYNGNSDFEKEFQSFVHKKISPSLTDSRVYSYKNGIISLYGFLERFIEDVLVEYLKEVCHLTPDYEYLPSAIKKNHLDVSIEHISKIKRNRSISDNQRKSKLENAIENMRNCFTAAPEYEINLDAFINHSSNFRYDSIHDIFCRIGVEGISKSCLKDEPLGHALSRKHSSAEMLEEKLLVSLLITELDDLAQRRNEIAHGVRVDEIESLDILEDRIDIIRKYVNALHKVLVGYLNVYTFETADKIELGKPSNAYGGIRVIEFDSLMAEDSGEIRVGDNIFAINKDSSKRMLLGKILSLKNQQGDIEYLSYPFSDAFSIGVNFDLGSHILKRTVYVEREPPS
jgi:hypothetical protein